MLWHEGTWQLASLELAEALDHNLRCLNEAATATDYCETSILNEAIEAEATVVTPSTSHAPACPNT